jgi:hypothetical protein
MSWRTFNPRLDLSRTRRDMAVMWAEPRGGCVSIDRSGFWNGELLMASTNPLGRRESGSVKSLDITFMAANAVGIVLYLRLASRGWRIPQEQGMVPIAGEPFVWALALPVLGVFFLADVVWVVLLLRDRESKRGLWWLVTAAVWLLAIGMDFSRH